MFISDHIVHLLLFLALFKGGSAVAGCTYPSQWAANSYTDSEKGSVTFTNTTMDGWLVTLTSIQTTVSSWECFLRNGSIIISKNKNALMIHGFHFYAFICMVLDFKGTHFLYKLWSDKEPGADGERVYVNTHSQPDLCEVCNKEFIPNASEIKYMCTKDTCGQIDVTQYSDPVTICSDQPTQEVTTSEMTTPEKLPSNLFDTSTVNLPTRSVSTGNTDLSTNTVNQSTFSSNIDSLTTTVNPSTRLSSIANTDLSTSTVNPLTGLSSTANTDSLTTRLSSIANTDLSTSTVNLSTRTSSTADTDSLSSTEKIDSPTTTVAPPTKFAPSENTESSTPVSVHHSSEPASSTNKESNTATVNASVEVINNTETYPTSFTPSLAFSSTVTYHLTTLSSSDTSTTETHFTSELSTTEDLTEIAKTTKFQTTKTTLTTDEAEKYTTMSDPQSIPTSETTVVSPLTNPTLTTLKDLVRTSMAPSDNSTPNLTSVTDRAESSITSTESSTNKDFLFTNEALITSILLCLVIIMFVVLIVIALCWALRRQKLKVAAKKQPHYRRPLHIKLMYHDKHAVYFHSSMYSGIQDKV